MSDGRWRFLDADDPHRVATIARIDAWWAELARRADDLDALSNRREQWDLPRGWTRTSARCIRS
jgi:hypothetical protein